MIAVWLNDLIDDGSSINSIGLLVIWLELKQVIDYAIDRKLIDNHFWYEVIY